MPKAVVPVNPGVLSAWGLLTVDLVQDRSRTILKRRHALDEAELADTLTELRASIEEGFGRAGVAPDAIRYEYFLDLQYYGQVFALSVGLGDYGEAPPAGDDRGEGVFRLSEEGALSIPLEVGEGDTLVVTPRDLEAATERFHREHEREYGHSDREQEVQVVHARVFGAHAVPKPASHAAEDGAENADAALRGRRRVRFDGAYHDTPIYDRSALHPGQRIEGPAMIDEASSTTALPPGAIARVDGYGNLVIEVG